jgi:hypothetical protein
MAAISARNFQSNSLSGAVSVTNGFANILLPTNAFALEGNKSFVIKLRKGSIQGDVIATSPTITLQDNSSFVSLTANTATVNEGNLVSFTLVTANAVNGATLFYSVNPVTANLTFSDFYNGSNTGYATIINNQATFTLYANTDSGYVDETGETFRIQLRTDSITGNVVYSSTSNVAITDFYKSYNILGFTENASSVTEGGTITLTFTAHNVPAGTLFYYYTDGNATTSTFTGGNTGSFIMNGTSNTISLPTLNVPYGTTQNFNVKVREASSTGTLYATSNSLVILDASLVDIQATGGNVFITSDGYKIHAYNTSSTFAVTYTGSSANVEYLVVAGGAGGGGREGYSGGAGGGGAGAVQSGYSILSSTGTFTVTIGGGGNGGSNNTGAAGSNSSILFGTSASTGNVDIKSGTGGGGRGFGPGNGGTSGNGFAGGQGGSGGGGPGSGGGGGGAGAVGDAYQGGGGSPGAGNGGVGVNNSIFGVPAYRGGGGGGGSASGEPRNGVGGTGGGGNGNAGGLVNSGGGGGGGGEGGSTAGQGGSGVVIIKYPFTSQIFNTLTTTANVYLFGENISFNLGALNANNITLYYTTEGNVDASHFISGNTGSFVANATGNVITLYSNSSATIPTGQTRNFRLQVRQDSTSGFVSISSANVALINSADYYMQATGGNILIANGYKTHTFTSSGNLNVTGLGFTSTASNAEILVVAGGGGGGIDGGGGGGGGLLYGNINLSAQNYTVVIGGGGAPDPAGFNPAYGQPSRYGLRGGNTTLSPSIVAIGGGGGAGGYGGLFQAGGSGAGGHQDYGTHSVAGLQGPSGGLTGYKGNGATYNPQASGGGGGGGAGGNGSMAPPVNGNAQPGAGGGGFDTSISGSPVVYSAGGRGKLFSAGFPAPVSTIGTLAQNIGAGGTAGGGDSQTGSPGIVILRYPFVGQYFAGLTISPLSSNSISQGANAIFDLSVQGANAITYYYTTNGNVNASHFIGGNTGSFVANTTGAIIRLQSNTNIPTNETRNFSLDVRQTSITGTVLISSPNVIINGPLPRASDVSYLLVAGGGSGGSRHAGGGGAGGYLTNNSYPVTPGAQYTVVVGGGGAVAPGTTVSGINGSNTYISSPSITTINAVGGGGGAGGASSAKNGGSGGGGGGFQGAFGTGYNYPGPTQQGYPGGAPDQGPSGFSGNGGGGAAGTGVPNPGGGGAGGVGLYNSITGSSVAYAGGGGGGGYFAVPGGAGGVGGGGAGYTGPSAPAAVTGSTNTGGGGGGSGGTPAYDEFGGAGGSGVVIIAHPTAYVTATTSGANVSVVTVSGNIIYKFFDSGTITF